MLVEYSNFQAPEEQTKGFIFPKLGNLSLYGQDVPLKSLSVLDENEGKLLIKAKEDSQFVIVLSEPQETAIHTRGGSIHTNEAAINRSFQRIKEIGVNRNYMTS